MNTTGERRCNVETGCICQRWPSWPLFSSRLVFLTSALRQQQKTGSPAEGVGRGHAGGPIPHFLCVCHNSCLTQIPYPLLLRVLPSVARYKHPASDCAVFIANLFMLGFMVEQLVRGRTLEEECEYPLWAWLIVQVVLVVLLQIMAPLCLVVPKKPHLLSPVLSLSLFLLQWMWLMVGWVWALSPSDCETQAPFNFSGAFWTVIVYSVAVPMEILWYMRIYVAFWQTNPKGCDCPCAPAAINDLDV